MVALHSASAADTAYEQPRHPARDETADLADAYALLRRIPARQTGERPSLDADTPGSE